MSVMWYVDSIHVRNIHCDEYRTQLGEYGWAETLEKFEQEYCGKHGAERGNYQVTLRASRRCSNGLLFRMVATWTRHRKLRNVPRSGWNWVREVTYSRIDV